MANPIAPSHWFYFQALQNKLYWLFELTQDYVAHYHNPNFQNQYTELKKQYQTTFNLLSKKKLNQALDDTPLDSFLTHLDDQLHLYQYELFRIFLENLPSNSILNQQPLSLLHLKNRFSEISEFFGRKIAQEIEIKSPLLFSIFKKNYNKNSASLLIKNKTLHNGLFEVFQIYLEGGHFHSRPLLLRRSTAEQLEYELRSCPHQRQKNSNKISEDVNDFSCEIESRLYIGLTKALIPHSTFERIKRNNYCFDRIHCQET